MRDEGFGSPYNVLNVGRDADLDAVEASFARSYKAARRSAGGERRRQELNAALETLREQDRRAGAEVLWYHLPLDPAERIPTAEDLSAELLPVELPVTADAAAEVRAPSPGEVLAAYLESLPEPAWPDARALLRQLTAVLPLRSSDPS
ncbi:MAG: hypothetical protein HYU66_16820 [Armatimonadetes bacterium]|nr:hypothetical protein [Armatimonadota bacterium]